VATAQGGARAGPLVDIVQQPGPAQFPAEVVSLLGGTGRCSSYEMSCQLNMTKRWSAQDLNEPKDKTAQELPPVCGLSLGLISRQQK
jgi:hypothetical protein